MDNLVIWITLAVIVLGSGAAGWLNVRTQGKKLRAVLAKEFSWDHRADPVGAAAVSSSLVVMFFGLNRADEPLNTVTDQLGIIVFDTLDRNGPRAYKLPWSSISRIDRVSSDGKRIRLIIDGRHTRNVEIQVKSKPQQIQGLIDTWSQTQRP